MVDRDERGYFGRMSPERVLTPQLASRVAVLGVVALVLFASILLRLWYLQVLTGDASLAKAASNHARHVPIPAARGDIVDRSGAKLVTSKVAAVVEIAPRRLPQDPAPVFRRLARTLGDVPAAEIAQRVAAGEKATPYADVTIETDVDRAVFNHIREYQDDFPGVSVDTRYLRSYPDTQLGAQLFNGLDRQYDRYLRGRDGVSRLTVDAFGARDDAVAARTRKPVQGERLKLTLDGGLEKAGDDALARAISASAYGAKAGAYVALDPRNGDVLAAGSQPGYDANVLAKPFSRSTWDRLSNGSDAPLIDRAIQSTYPTGSVFKPVTALAALSSGLVRAGARYDDTGTFTLGAQTWQNAKGLANGAVDLARALEVSSDTYFYRLGYLANGSTAIQREARALGYGRRTGIDLPDESAGRVPDSTWRTQGYARYEACRQKAGLADQSQAALRLCGGIDKPWTVGDNVGLAVGQGDLEATPLQVAVAYAALANGGKVVRPHLGAAIEDASGATVKTLHARPARKVAIDPRARAVILDGLHRAAASKHGTSYDVFKGWPMKRYPVYGKTGTAQRGGNRPDQAWYAAFVNDPKRPIVVVVTVERGGFGAETAAPAARLILSRWFGTGDRAFHTGTSTTR